MRDAPALADSRFARLSALLDHDPRNVGLLHEAAQAALDENRPDPAAELLERSARIAPLSAEALGLAGLVAMQREQWTHAAQQYRALMAQGEDAPAIRFNLAWSLAMAKEFESALALLGDTTVQQLPQAAQLLVQLLHQRGDLAAAEAQAHALIERHPDHRGLNAVVATLAIDIEDLALAERCARAAGDHPDALITRGTLALEDDPAEAATLFEAALSRNPRAPRALIGRGLTRLLRHDKAGAAHDLDSGAELFGTHLGSWIAAGWAHFIAGDIASAKARFETALEMDGSFAESHGSLAVIDIVEGRPVSARERTAVALRLDRACFSAALASTLLTAGVGDAEAAKRIFAAALETPIDDSGRTIAQSLARLGLAG